MTVTLTREDCLKLAETLDAETKSYLVDDCIATWDTKNLWHHEPIAYYEDKTIVSVMFANVEDVGGEHILYIQRVFTIPEFRKKGHFRELFNEVYTSQFNSGARFLKLFVNVDAYKAYKAMKFNMVQRTEDGKYYLIFIPMLHSVLEYNNFINSLSPTSYFLPDTIKRYYLDLQRKYNIIDV